MPPKTEEVINKALEKDPSLRYQLASDIRTDLQRLKRDTESGKVPSDTATAPWSRRPILIGAIGFVFVIAVIAVAALYFGSSDRTRIKSVAVLPSRMRAPELYLALRLPGCSAERMVLLGSAIDCFLRLYTIAVYRDAPLRCSC